MLYDPHFVTWVCGAWHRKGHLDALLAYCVCPEDLRGMTYREKVSRIYAFARAAQFCDNSDAKKQHALWDVAQKKV